MPDERWHTLENGEHHGPFSRRELVARLVDGAPVALVQRDGSTAWTPPQDLTELEMLEVDEAPPSL